MIHTLMIHTLTLMIHTLMIHTLMIHTLMIHTLTLMIHTLMIHTLMIHTLMIHTLMVNWGNQIQANKKNLYCHKECWQMMLIQLCCASASIGGMDFDGMSYGRAMHWMADRSSEKARRLRTQHSVGHLIERYLKTGLPLQLPRPYNHSMIAVAAYLQSQ